MASRQLWQADCGRGCAPRETVSASRFITSDCAGPDNRGPAQSAFVLDPRAQDVIRT